MAMLRSFATVSGLTLLSRAVGFVRDMLAAAALGQGPLADSVTVALRLPNLFRSLFAEGAFSVSFVPLYAGLLEKDGQGAARQFAAQALSWMLAILIPLTVLAVLGMGVLVGLIAPGFADTPEKMLLTEQLSRIAFPYLALVSVSALLGGVLNAHGRLGPFAAAPVLFNVTQIIALSVWRHPPETVATVIVTAVTVSGVLQVLWLYLSCRRLGVSPVPRLPKLSPAVKRLGLVMAPAIAGAGVLQINVFVSTILASSIPGDGAIAALYYADRLNQLPLGVIGVALGIVLLPSLSRLVASGDLQAAQQQLNRGLEFGLTLGLPAALALMTMSVPLISVLFERGAFDAAATARAAPALSAYALAIPAFVLSKILSAGFYARQDTRNPVLAAALSTSTNIALALVLLPSLQHVGLALATGITAWLNTGFLVWKAHRAGFLRTDSRLRRNAPVIALATAAMVGVLYGLRALLDGWLFGAPLPLRLLSLGLLIGGGLLTFALGAVAGGVVRAADLRRMLRRSAA